MKAALKRIELTPFTIWLGVLSLILAIGVAGMVVVFAKGLIVTNLTDLVPWGLWITIDLSSIALSAGAFLLCAAVYILKQDQYAPVARTATFIGIIGYSMAMLCLLLDIGRPDRFWHGFVFWNVHSVLWEVTMCVGLYFSVLLLETLPIIGGWSWLKERYPDISEKLESIHKLAPFLAIIGLCLSLLHQSSLGATYGVLKARPIWTSGLSILFILSAALGGPALTVAATTIASKVTDKAKINDELLDSIASFIGWGLILYLYYRFWDAFSMTYTYLPGRNEGLQILTQGRLSMNFWVGEILLGTMVPIFILRNDKLRKNQGYRTLALLMVVGGVIAYRWDVNLSGQLVLLSYLPQDIVSRYTTYSPSLVEIIIGAGIIAYGLLAFTLGVKYLNVVDHTCTHEDGEHLPVMQPASAGD